MKPWVRHVAAFCALPLFLTGCIENAMMVNLNPDGTGTLAVRVLTGTDMAALGKGESEGEDRSLREVLSDPDQFGEGLELVSIKDVANKNGWKGVMATYSFRDIEKLRFAPAEMEQAEEGGPDNLSASMGGGVRYRFEFQPGRPATLIVHPELEDTGEASEDPVEAGSGEDPFALAGLEESDAAPNIAGGIEDMGEQMAMAMMSSMGSMMKGMRISYLLQFNGEIKDTNAQFRPKDNSIIVLDMKVDQLLDHPQAMSKLSGGVEELSALAAMNLPALKMQDPREPLVVRFE